jgi:hypothetical protein
MKASIGMMIMLLAGAPALAQPPDVLPAEETRAGDAAATTVEPVLPAAAIRQAASDAQAAEVQAADDGALSLEELGELRGGETIVIQDTTQTLTANNSGNSVNGDAIGSGAVNLGANAFNGYDGIGNFVINTGHNNNLQGSISVSIAMTPQ